MEGEPEIRDDLCAVYWRISQHDNVFRVSIRWVCSNEVSAALITIRRSPQRGLLFSGQLQLSRSTGDVDATPFLASMQNVRDFLPARDYVLRQYLLIARSRIVISLLVKILSETVVFIARLDFFPSRENDVNEQICFRWGKAYGKEVQPVFAR